MRIKIVTKTLWPSFMNVAVHMKNALSNYCICNIYDQTKAESGGNILFIGTVSREALLLLSKFRKDSNVIFYGTTEGHSFLDEESLDVAKQITIIAVSNFVKQMLEDVGIYVAGVVHHGLDMDNRRVDPPFYQALKERYGNRTVIFTVSANQSRKGLNTLLRGYQLITKKTDKTYLILHSEPTGYYSLVKMSKNIERVWLTNLFGKLCLKELNAFYRLCDIYVQPSYCEGFGLPILEAFRFDKPVIAVDAPPFNELIRQRETGILVPLRKITWLNYSNKILFKMHMYNMEDLANAICEILTNPPFLTKMQDNIRNEKQRWNIYALYPNILDYFT